MLGSPLGESPAPVEMRVDDDSSTESARGGSIYADAPIRLSSFSEKEVPPGKNVQRHKCKEQVHYLLKEDKGGAQSSNEAHRTSGNRPRKKKTKKRNINIISNDARGKESNKEERRSRKRSKSEDKFLADLEAAFPSHTTGTQEYTPAPRQRGSKNIANRKVRVGRWHARRGYSKKSRSLKQLIGDTKSKLEPTEQQILDTMNDI